MRKINPNAEYVRMNNNGRLKKEYRGQVAKVIGIRQKQCEPDKNGLICPVKIGVKIKNEKIGKYEAKVFLARHFKEELSKWSLPVIWWRIKYLLRGVQNG